MRTVIAVAALAALAGCSAEKRQEKRAEADAKAAGFVPPSVMSRLDFGGSMERRFRTLDRNADDFVDASEMPRRGARLWTFDRNHDGKVSAIEFSEGQLARFDRMDLNHDGTVTSEEQQASRNGIEPMPTASATGTP